MSALMIPGEFERTPKVPVPALKVHAAVPVGRPIRAIGGSDPRQLEREREGGGAPNQRAGVRRGTLMGRLWQTARHPTERRAIWRRGQLAPA